MRFKVLLIAATAAFWPVGATAEPMTFSLDWSGGNCEGCSWIRAEGTIENDTPDKFRKFLEDADTHEGMIVRLNSPGGNLGGGLRLGKLIRQHRFNTMVGSSEAAEPGSSERRIIDGRCASACGYAFLGGIVRTARENEIGLHQFYMSSAQKRPDEKVFSAIDASDDQILTGILLDYTTSMGVDAGYVRIAAGKRPKEMYYLNQRELNELRVNWNSDEFLPWNIEVSGDGIMAASRSKGRNLNASLFCRKDKSVWLRFSVMKAGERHRMEGMIAVHELEIFGFPASAKDVTVKETSYSYQMDVRLRTFDLKLLPTDDASFVIEPIDHGRAGYGVYTQLNAAGAEANFRAALKNCI